MCFPIAAHDETNDQVLEIRVTRVGDASSSLPDGTARMTVSTEYTAWYLEGRRREQVPRKLDLGHLFVPCGNLLTVTIYNDLAFIELMLRRDFEGFLSVDVKKGTFQELYERHHQVLLKRHGNRFARFDDIECVN